MNRSISSVVPVATAAITLFSAINSHSQPKPTLFTLLPPSQTGVHFENTVKDTKEANILLYSNFYGGAGVGTADFNNDGLTDIVFMANTAGDRLYLNKGNLRFEDITEKAGLKNQGGWSSGVAVADVNNDGWMDFYVSRELHDSKPDLRKNKLYINKGKTTDGTPAFIESSEQYGVADNGWSRQAVFFDHDNDGDVDLFVLNQTPNTGNFSELFGVKPGPLFAPRMYRNNSNGTFTDITRASGLGRAGYPNSASASDFNNDGWTDLYVANDFDVPDFFYINRGDGTFANVIDESMKHLPFYSMGVDAADLNNDGWLDLMVVDMVAEDNYRIKSNMSGMNPKAFWKVVDQGGHYQYMFNTLQINTAVASNGKFTVPQFSDIGQMTGMSNTDWSWSNLIADLDNDGLKDIYVTNGLLRDIRNTDSDKAFSHYVEEISNNWTREHPNSGEVSIWDILNLEEALKIVPTQRIAKYAFKNNGDLSFTKVAEEWGLDYKGFSHGSAYADLDNDGDLDLVVNNVNDVAHIYRNNSNPNGSNNNYFRIHLTDEKGHKPIFGSRVQVEVNGKKQWVELTCIRGMYSSSETIAHFGVGKEKLVDLVTITWPDGKKTLLRGQNVNQVVVVDRSTSSDTGKDDSGVAGKTLFEKSDIISYQHQEDEFDDYARQVLLPHKMSQFGPALAVADVNGDGMEDCFVGAATGFGAKLFLQQPDGTFISKEVAAFTRDAIYEDMDAAFFDADGDKDPDLYVVSGGNSWKKQSPEYEHRLYTNDGKGNFTRSEKVIPSIRESGACVRPFDFDKDGDLDLFVGGRHVPWEYPAPATSRILLNEKGVFRDVTRTMASDLLDIGLVTDAAWMDFDQDGHADLILVGEWMAPAFIKYDGRRFTNATGDYGVEGSHGWWYSISAADMDNDGDQDFVAGNLGLNYKYKATPKEPFEVFYDDFDRNGTKDIVLSYYNFGEKYPLRGRSCSSDQIPQIKEKFASYNLFASAKLTDVYGEENLQEALHYQANIFATSYFENLGNGKFKMKALPNEAQVSNVHDFVIEDLDGDGLMDILLAGNLYTAEIETPRNDAGVGLFLKGDGKGNFKAVAPYESGLCMRSDVKKLAIVRAQGARHVLGAVNNGKMEVFKLNK